VVASVASFRSLNLIQGLMARAVSPAASAPVLRDRPPQPAALHTATPVALAPAAMTALLQAQEQMDKDAPVLARTPTVIVIDRLIAKMVDAPVAAMPVADAPLTLRRLETARQRLTEA
jgi:hypothetical protein